MGITTGLLKENKVDRQLLHNQVRRISAAPGSEQILIVAFSHRKLVYERAARVMTHSARLNKGQDSGRIVSRIATSLDHGNVRGVFKAYHRLLLNSEAAINRLAVSTAWLAQKPPFHVLTNLYPETQPVTPGQGGSSPGER